MNIDKSVFGVLSILVAVIVVATVAIPVIEDSSKEIHSTVQNTAQKYYAKSSSDLSEDLTITLVSRDNYTINGESYELNPNGVVIITDMGDMWILYNDNYYLYQKINNHAFSSLSIGGSTTFYTDGTYVATTATGTEYTGTFGNVVYPSVDGDLGYFFNTTAYADDASDVIFFSTSINNSGAMYAIKFKATGEEVEKIVSPFSSGAEVTLTDLTMTYNAADETIADNAIDGLTYRVGETEYTTKTFIAPLEYKTITNKDSAMISILQIVPLLLLIVPVMMAIRMYSSRGE